MKCACRIDGEEAALPTDARHRLEVKPGDRVHVIPFD